VGTPPLGIFVGKLTTATAAWDSGTPALTIALLLTTVLSLFYYLRWIAPSFATSEHGAPRRPGESAGGWSSRVAVVAAALSLVLGLGAGPVWDVLSRPLP
jgi:NADH-quinone oxidoreductase subunit N